jgi:ubiquinone/menaquinone biosynthesis C-methylase UbiE
MEPNFTIIHLGGGGDDHNIFRNYDKIGRHDIKVICIDLDEDTLRRNPCENKCIADAEAMCFPNEFCDLIVTEHVFEHLQKPKLVLQECARILKNGGKLIFAIPNKWSYISLIAKITPLWVHVYVKKRDGWIRTDKECYKTYYRLNTVTNIKRIAKELGFEILDIRTFVGHPCYGRFMPSIHRLLILLHRLMECCSFLSPFHINIVGVLVLQKAKAKHSGKGVEK